MRISWIIPLLTLIIISTSSMASNIYIGTGNLTQYVGRYSQDSGEDTNTFDFNPYLAAGLDYEIVQDFLISTEAGFVVSNKKRDENINIFTYFFNTALVYKLSSFRFKLGLGLLSTRISSDIETQTLDNGNGTSDFPMPPGPLTSRNLLTNIGADFYVNDSLSLGAIGHIYNLTDSEARAFGYSLNLNYHFGDISKKKPSKRSLRKKRRLKKRRRTRLNKKKRKSAQEVL